MKRDLFSIVDEENPVKKITSPDDIAALRSNLYAQLWNVADELRGRMDSSNFKNYMLSVIFYKNLSERTEVEVKEFLANEPEEYRDFTIAWKEEDYREEIASHLVHSLGYVIEPEDLFANLVKQINLGVKGEWHIDKLSSAFTKVTASTIGKESQEDFEGLFSSIDLNSPSLGKDLKEKTELMGRVLLRIAAIDFHSNDVEIDLLGDAYEYLIGRFASDAGKSGGEFYTPQEVATLMAKIVAAKKPALSSVYDPTCGSGSLLFRVMREASKADAEKARLIQIAGQELNIETYNLARMNLILHNVPWQNFNIQNGDTLAEDLHEGKTFDSIVANPPYSIKWQQPSDPAKDVRFAPAGALAPASKADLAFVQHIVHHLKDDGIATVVLPVGILYRGGKEALIRKWLVESNYVDAIIGLPGGIFNAGVTTMILVLKKDRAADAKVRFIDASEGFVKTKQLNLITQESISKVLEHYIGDDGLGKDEEGYSRLVSLEELRENDHSLQLNLYVSKPLVNDLPSLKEVRMMLENNERELSNLQNKVTLLFQEERK